MRRLMVRKETPYYGIKFLQDNAGVAVSHPNPRLEARQKVYI